MARPLYETSNDRDRELIAINRLLKGTDKEPIKLPIIYGIDYAVKEDGCITSWVEVKCRSNESTKYPTLMISAAKIWTGVEMFQITKLPFFLVCEWTDKIGFLKIHTVAGYCIRIGGRTDRGDAQDIEPVYYIPIDKFTMKEINNED